MKTQRVESEEKRMISMNFDRKLWKNLHVEAAQRESTITSLLEHLVREHLDECKHIELK